MPLTNAQKQKRFREKQKKKLKQLVKRIKKTCHICGEWYQIRKVNNALWCAHCYKRSK